MTEAPSKRFLEKQLLECAKGGKGQHMLDLLDDEHVDVDARSRCGRTSLHYAAREGHRKITEIALEHGANPNIRNHWLESPLHAAAYGGRQDLVELLLAAGADPLTQTEHGKTALDFAQIGLDKGKFRKNFQTCVDLLKEAEKKWREKMAK